MPQLAVVLGSDKLPSAALLAAFKPLLQSQHHPKCLFESKRAYTELHHQGIQLAGGAGWTFNWRAPELHAYWYSLLGSSLKMPVLEAWLVTMLLHGVQPLALCCCCPC
jgi:hypothetical protein